MHLWLETTNLFNFFVTKAFSLLTATCCECTCFSFNSNSINSNFTDYFFPFNWRRADTGGGKLGDLTCHQTNKVNIIIGNYIYLEKKTLHCTETGFRAIDDTSMEDISITKLKTRSSGSVLAFLVSVMKIRGWVKGGTQ